MATVCKVENCKNNIGGVCDKIDTYLNENGKCEDFELYKKE